MTPAPRFTTARASIVASGTATVEAALIGNPFLVVYRVSPLTYSVAQRVVDVPHVAMVNLIAGRRAVPELIQGDFTAENLVSHLQPLLNDEASPRRNADQPPPDIGYAQGQRQSRPSRAIDRVAEIASQMLHQQKSHKNFINAMTKIRHAARIAFAFLAILVVTAPFARAS